MVWLFIRMASNWCHQSMAWICILLIPRCPRWWRPTRSRKTTSVSILRSRAIGKAIRWSPVRVSHQASSYHLHHSYHIVSCYYKFNRNQLFRSYLDIPCDHSKCCITSTFINEFKSWTSSDRFIYCYKNMKIIVLNNRFSKIWQWLAFQREHCNSKGELPFNIYIGLSVHFTSVPAWWYIDQCL